ncbi:MAG: DUF1905 domain-containing protein [Patescibacteria group bacterium]
MKTAAYPIRAKVWLYPGDPSTRRVPYGNPSSSGQVSPWHFVTIEKKSADEIKKEYIWPRRGFGAIPVQVTINKTSWKTSIFPDKDGTYLLPLKKEVRAKENIKAGSTVTVAIEVIT